MLNIYVSNAVGSHTRKCLKGSEILGVCTGKLLLTVIYCFEALRLSKRSIIEAERNSNIEHDCKEDCVKFKLLTVIQVRKHIIKHSTNNDRDGYDDGC